MSVLLIIVAASMILLVNQITTAIEAQLVTLTSVYNYTKSDSGSNGE